MFAVKFPQKDYNYFIEYKKVFDMCLKNKCKVCSETLNEDRITRKYGKDLVRVNNKETVIYANYLIANKFCCQTCEEKYNI